MQNLLIKLLGINWRTTILGVGVIVAAGGRVVLAFKTKNFDFAALAVDGQLIVTTLGALLAGAGLLIAKDSSVTGVGGAAKTVDSSGVLTNVAGNVVGTQPTVSEVAK